MLTNLPSGLTTDHPTGTPTDPPIESGPTTDSPTGTPTDPPIEFEYFAGIADVEESESDSEGEDEEDDGMCKYERLCEKKFARKNAHLLMLGLGLNNNRETKKVPAAKKRKVTSVPTEPSHSSEQKDF